MELKYKRLQVCRIANILPGCGSVFIAKLSSCLGESIRRLQCLELQTADRNKSNGNREGGRLWMLVDHKHANIWKLSQMFVQYVIELCSLSVINEVFCSVI